MGMLAPSRVLYRDSRNLLDVSKIDSVSISFGLTIGIDGDYFTVKGFVSGVEEPEAYFRIGEYSDTSLSGKSYTFTLFEAPSEIIKIYGFRTEDETQIAVGAKIQNGQEIDWRFKVTVSDGAMSSYEPYGVKIPYEAPGTKAIAFHGDHKPVKVATYRQSRNLLDPNKLIDSDTQNAYQIEDGELKIVNTQNDAWTKLGSYGVLKAGNYVAHGDNIDIKRADDHSQIICTIYDNAVAAVQKFTLDSDTEVKIKVGYARDDYPYISKAMLELGSEVRPYEPYGLIEQPISEPVDTEQTGKALTFDNTYNDTAEVTIYGESQQKTLTGKNILTGSGDDFSIGSTADGLAFENLDGGVVKIDATAEHASGWVQTSSRVNPSSVAQHDGDSIAVSMDLKIEGSVEGSIAIYLCSNNGYYTLVDDVSKLTTEWQRFSLPTTFKSTPTFDNLHINVGDFTGVLYARRPQVEIASEATDYEPYCGGIPSPNPDYPQEITSLSKASVGICGRNLLNGDFRAASAGEGITCETLDDGIVKVVANKNPINYVNCGCSLRYKTLTAGDSITISIDFKADNGFDGYPMVYICNNNGYYAFMKTETLTTNWKRYSYTTTWKNPSNDTNSINNSFHIGVCTFSGTLYARNPQVEIASEPHPYQPYQSSSLDLTSLLNGKELRSLPDGTRDELIIERDGTVKLVEKVGAGGFSGDGVNLVHPNAADTRWYVQYDKAHINKGVVGTATVISNMFKSTPTCSTTKLKDFECCVESDYHTIFIKDSSMSNATKDEFLSKYESCVFYYKLETPITTTLGTIDPPQTFYDQTNVWEVNGADISAHVRVMPE